MDHSNFMSDYVQTLIDKFTKDMLVWDNGEGEKGQVRDLWFAVDVALQIHRGMEKGPVQKELPWGKKRRKR